MCCCQAVKEFFYVQYSIIISIIILFEGNRINHSQEIKMVLKLILVLYDLQ